MNKTESELIAVAAELLRCADIPDPDLPEFRPMGKMAVRQLRRDHVRLANQIRRSLSEIRKTSGQEGTR